MEKKRFTQRKYPIAAGLLNKNFVPLRLVEDNITDKYNYERASLIYSKIAPLINSVDIVTQPFYDAAIAAAKSLLDFDCLQHVPDFHIYNSFIIGKAFHIFEAEKKDGLISCYGCWFYLDFCVGYSTAKIDLTDRKGISDVAQALNIPNPANPAGGCLVLTLFKAFADIESNILPVNEKTELFRCSYLNNLPENVNLLTCRWFTELHQDNPFFVRGHWRWQPHGTGNKLRKLIWVDIYTKGGYHAPAERVGAG